MLKRDKGNTLVEYAVPLALIVVATASVLMTTDANSILTSFFTRSVNGSTANTQAGTIRVATTNSDRASVMMTPGQRADVTVDNIALHLPVIAEETAGSLGDQVTSQLAQTLDAIADALEAAGEDASLVAMIRELAAQGHDIGDQEAYLISSCIGDSSCFVGTVAAERNTHDHDDRVSNAMAAINPLTRNFSDSLERLNTAMGSRHPGIQAIINNAAHDIVNIADLYHTAAAAPEVYEAPVGGLINPGNVRTAVVLNNNAVLTHQNADTICSTAQNGGGSCRRS